LDYVANWFLVASRQISHNGGQAAFVATNSITQGTQPAIIWTQLRNLGISISFAHQSFQWANEASGQATVQVVIVGFSDQPQKTKRRLWQYPNQKGKPVLMLASNINGYLLDAPDILVSSRRRPLSVETPPLDNGNKPADGGFLSDISVEEAKAIQANDPVAAQYLRRIVGARELIHNEERYCLWLLGASPTDIRSSPELRSRTASVRNMREQSTKAKTKADANRPAEFQEIRQPSQDFIAVPKITSEEREYVPIALFTKDIIVNDRVSIIENGSLSLFGLISSKPFNVWNKAVSGRLESRTNISSLITYNNFPFPKVSEPHEKEISQLAEAILTTREQFATSSLADLYDPNSMPPSLRKAHEALDKAVLKAFGMKPSLSDNEILRRLFELYKEQTAGLV
jgi:hypothetical protein